MKLSFCTMHQLIDIIKYTRNRNKLKHSVLLKPVFNKVITKYIELSEKDTVYIHFFTEIITLR